jgi:hypothetical protein
MAVLDLVVQKRHLAVSLPNMALFKHKKSTRGLIMQFLRKYTTDILKLVCLLLMCSVPKICLCKSNFIRVQLGKGASIEVPKNWIVLSDDQRVLLDTAVESIAGNKNEVELNFAANLYDIKGQRMAHINARFYPENPLTQNEVKDFTVSDISSLDSNLKKATKSSGEILGQAVEWYGLRKEKIGNLIVLVHEHKSLGNEKEEATHVRGLRVSNYPRSFTVTMSYRIRDESILRPIIDYMTNSLQQENELETDSNENTSNSLTKIDISISENNTANYRSEEDNFSINFLTEPIINRVPIPIMNDFSNTYQAVNDEGFIEMVSVQSIPPIEKKEYGIFLESKIKTIINSQKATNVKTEDVKLLKTYDAIYAEYRYFQGTAEFFKCSYFFVGSKHVFTISVVSIPQREMIVRRRLASFSSTFKE